MLELITMSLFTLCYIKACIDEKREEEIEKEKERIRDLKIKVFCYAVRNRMLYEDVVKLLQEGKLHFDNLDEN